MQEPTPVVVAIVDDDEAVRRALRRLLRSLSYATIDFDSGEAFLEGIAGHSPSCVLLDLQMPGLMGLEVLGEMRRRGLTIPVVVITGSDRAGLGDQCLSAGASAYLVKPLDGTQLAGAIDLARGEQGVH